MVVEGEEGIDLVQKLLQTSSYVLRLSVAVIHAMLVCQFYFILSCFINHAANLDPLSGITTTTATPHHPCMVDTVDLDLALVEVEAASHSCHLLESQ